MPTDPPSYAITYEGFAGIVGVHNAYEPDVKVGRKVLKVYDINPETGELTEHDARPKVTVEQVRKFIEELLKTAYSSMKSGPGELNKVLVFIDNGPKKPTAEDVIEECIESDYQLSGNRIARALREAGYLKDEV